MVKCQLCEVQYSCYRLRIKCTMCKYHFCHNCVLKLESPICPQCRAPISEAYGLAPAWKVKESAKKRDEDRLIMIHGLESLVEQLQESLDNVQSDLQNSEHTIWQLSDKISELTQEKYEDALKTYKSMVADLNRKINALEARMMKEDKEREELEAEEIIEEVHKCYGDVSITGVPYDDYIQETSKYQELLHDIICLIDETEPKLEAIAQEYTFAENPGEVQDTYEDRVKDFIDDIRRLAEYEDHLDDRCFSSSEDAEALSEPPPREHKKRKIQLI